MQICKLQPKDIDQAMRLVKTVFDQYDAVDYPPLGRKTFYHFISPDNILQMMQSGEMYLYGAYVANQLAGVIAVRSVQHISLLFVREEYQKQGVAKGLVAMVKCKYTNQKLEKPSLTVNASPYAVEIYKKMGFEPLQGELEKDGIRFTPMEYRLIPS